MRFYKIGDHYLNLDTVVRVTVGPSAEDEARGVREEVTAYVYCMGIPPATNAAGDVLSYSFTLTGAEAEVLLKVLDNAISKDETFGAPSP